MIGARAPPDPDDRPTVSDSPSICCRVAPSIRSSPEYFNESPEVMQRLASGELPALCHVAPTTKKGSRVQRDDPRPQMVAHRLQGAFGPAQRLHGATDVLDATFRSGALDAGSIVVGIGRAARELHTMVSALSFRNLVDEPGFTSLNTTTTTEELARVRTDRLAARVDAGASGEAARGLAGIAVTLREPHVAWATQERTL